MSIKWVLADAVPPPLRSGGTAQQTLSLGKVKKMIFWIGY
ncbi:MAG: hypothetical protein PWQ89_1101 [Verrucomicrobiota bacterium]|jgi:hypothetical protein|nr:hypothetical protein [Verrucomicrobiota bacterium]